MHKPGQAGVEAVTGGGGDQGVGVSGITSGARDSRLVLLCNSDQEPQSVADRFRVWKYL